MKSFLIQPFHQRIHLTTIPGEFRRKYNAHAPENGLMELSEFEECRGMAAHLVKKGKPALFMLYLSHDYDEGTLYHESLHLAHFVMDYASAPISMESTETQAYLMEHIAATARNKLYG
jgi:hypothetical protein